MKDNEIFDEESLEIWKSFLKRFGSKLVIGVPDPITEEDKKRLLKEFTEI